MGVIKFRNKSGYGTYCTEADYHLTGQAFKLRLPTLRLQLLHLRRILLLDSLDRLVPVVFHHALLLEVFHLGQPSVMTLIASTAA